MSRQDRPLKESYPLPADLYPVWIRYIEKAALQDEQPAANEAAVRLMRANILSIGRLSEYSFDQLKNIPYVETHIPMLKKLLARISANPQIARPIKKDPLQ
ncbi:hypothetical protein [Paenibacillus camerounensis]|uniref:hypothetical protein n=1 Tax=Paenibacillus camerounensis TaxID=1243663 RepID=UPI0005A61F8A|nr:hypothetical protein [Paenibacillus camerounensis]